MKLVATRNTQRGVTLFVGLIMLVLITLMVTSAFMLSNTNLRSVANMQSRDEAIAAANYAISQVLSSPFTNNPVAEEINVDINNDNQAEYVVSIAAPVCIRAAVDATATVSSETLGPGMSTVNTWNTTWDIVATAQDIKTGTKTVVNVGARVLLEQAEKDAVCS
jgi:Tfp pilus assembly protein PilX